jgi:hypothetical protein
MNITPYPEDSVLRRHFESAAEMKRQLWLKQGPSDSVLRRHHDQMQQSIGTAQQPETGKVNGSQNAKTSPAVQAPPQPQRRGFFAWLERLLTR